MPLALKLLPTFIGLSGVPWSLVMIDNTKTLFRENFWFLGLLALTSAVSAFVIYQTIRGMRDASWNSMEQSLLVSGEASYSKAIEIDQSLPHAEIVRNVEMMREKLQSRISDLLDSIDANRQLDLKRKSEEEAISRKYIEAHTVFMENLCGALEKLADGDLTARLDEPFSSDYEPLRRCYNESIAKLTETFATTIDLVTKLSNATSQISTAADSLSNRTCQQAASLEQTSAALKQITTTVQRTAENAQNARDLVDDIRSNAENSSAVVHEAIVAMERINNSSQKIEQIIGVIDEIAFQTNLLALNAGVEAARAGDAGKGFAVVASEVRALAQRSAEAARGIKSLIASSTSQVQDGVSLVGRTGESLAQIVDQVGEANNIVSLIASGANEQSHALVEVNSALIQMDHFTQENAGMVQETTAATRSLNDDIQKLIDAVMVFQIHQNNLSRSDEVAFLEKARRPVPHGRRSIRAVSGSAETLGVEMSEENEWEEF